MRSDSYHTDSVQQAILLTLVATLMGALNNILIKVMGPAIDAATIMVVRSAITLPFLVVWMHRAGQPIDLSWPTLRLHFPRALAGTISYGLFLFAVQILPLAEATAISLSQPFFVAILAPLLLRERFVWSHVPIIALGFLGVLLVLKPSGDVTWYHALMFLLNPLFFAVALINIRHLSKTQSVLTITFFYSFFGLALPAPWVLLHPPLFPPIFWLYLVIIAMIGVVLQCAQSKALELAPASTVSPYYFTGLVWSILFAILFWGEWPDAWAWLGMGLIITMGLLLNFMARPQKPAL